MSVSTTGFVLTDKKDVFEVLRIIENILVEMVRKYSAEIDMWKDSTSKLPIIECRPESQFFKIYFKVNNEERMLMVHFDCDCDYSEYGGSKIIWSVNNWGLAEEIVLTICKEMKQFGKVFYEVNDCDSEVVEIK
jgi:hypothetical protein